MFFLFTPFQADVQVQISEDQLIKEQFHGWNHLFVDLCLCKSDDLLGHVHPVRPHSCLHVQRSLRVGLISKRRWRSKTVEPKHLRKTLVNRKHICAMVKVVAVAFFGGMVIPPFNRNPYNGYINPYYWVEFPIPYYMEIMGV